MRRGAQQDLALLQRLVDEADLAIFEIAKPAMDQLGRGRAGMAGKIVLLDQQHRGAADRRIPRDRTPIDAAADDEEVVAVHSRLAA